jgi:hypothetical protein
VIVSISIKLAATSTKPNAGRREQEKALHRTPPEEETVKQGKELRSQVGGDEELTSLRALLSVTTLGSGTFFFSAAAGGSVAITTSWPVNGLTPRRAGLGLGLGSEERPRKGSGGSGRQWQTNAAALWVLGGGEVGWDGSIRASPTVNEAAQKKHVVLLGLVRLIPLPLDWTGLEKL